MPVLTYKNEELALFKNKEDGKNKSAVDGFYADKENTKRFFVKKPADKKELFAELFAGLILKEFMSRGLIDPIYFPSLIVADWVQFPDGSYGLIQPMVSFTELHKLIGTSTADGKGRHEMKEALWGPQYYSSLAEKSGFGLSVALLFSLLLGAHSVHSGNMVSLDNTEMVSKQYARLDWGDAFRFFAHVNNNENLLYAYENRGWFNYKKLTKDYFLNYKLIPGLFPTIAEKASLLHAKADEKTMADIILCALREIPVDLLDDEAKKEFAAYSCMDSFAEVVFGKDSDGGQFALEMGHQLSTRLQKITQLEDLSATSKNKNNVNIYRSIIVASPVALQMEDKPFPELLGYWQGLLNKKGLEEVQLKQLDLEELIVRFNEYVNLLAAKSDNLNLWDASTEQNIFAPIHGEKPEENSEFPFIAQYKESSILRRLYSLDPKTGKPGTYPVYQRLSTDYAQQNPDSSWDKINKVLLTGQETIRMLIELKASQQFLLQHPTALSQVLMQLNYFMAAQTEITSLFDKETLATAPEPSATTSVFYPIADEHLKAMSAEQLRTLCLEEFNPTGPSDLIRRILKDEAIWHVLEPALLSYTDLQDKIKIAVLIAWRHELEKSELVTLETQFVDLAQFEMFQNLVTGIVEAQEKINALLAKDSNEDPEARLAFAMEIKALRNDVYSKKQQLKEIHGALKNSAMDELDKESSELLVSSATVPIANNADVLQLRQEKMKLINAQIDILEKKADDLNTRALKKKVSDSKESKACEAINTLVRAMRKAVNDYINAPVEEELAVTQFQEHVKPLIKTAGNVLGEHRQKWRYVLANLSLAVALAGVGYAIAILANKAFNDRYTFFSTPKSKEHLDNLEKTLNQTPGLGSS